MTSFDDEVTQRIRAQRDDEALRDATRAFLLASIDARYSYNFSWLGRPIIQYPQDMAALQEIVWRVQPTLIVETGIAHGGSLILSASLLAMLDWCDAATAGTTLDPRRSSRQVIGIDIDIRPHNRAAIEAHPLCAMIRMIQGSSVAPDVVADVHAAAAKHERVLVLLDSNHTHEHVAAELQAYAPLTSVGSYCVVFDTVVEDLPAESFTDRPWRPGNSPKSAVYAYLAELERRRSAGETGVPAFDIDTACVDKLQITVAPDGFLRRTA